MNSLSLFSGYSGLDMAISEWVKPILYCEKDLYAKGILLSRMDDVSIPFAPIWNDVTTLDGNKFRGLVDLIVGGFPCQDLSVAGRGEGLAGKRSGLFYEVVRLVKEIQPSFVFLENVPAIRTRGLEQVIKEFAEMGYDCRWTMLSASSVGASHKRERWFLLAHTKRNGVRAMPRALSRPQNEQQELQQEDGQTRSDNAQSFCADLAHTKRKRQQRQRQPIHPVSGKENSHWEAGHAFNECFPREWQTEPSVGRVVDGYPERSRELSALGNGVVPLQAKEAFIKLMGL